jgi:hypothetical protein
MIKPAAGYRLLAYSSPEAVQTTGTVVRDLVPPDLSQELLDELHREMLPGTAAF